MARRTTEKMVAPLLRHNAERAAYRDEQVFAAAQKLSRQLPHPPSGMDIAAALGWSNHRVHDAVVSLRKQGLIAPAARRREWAVRLPGDLRDRPHAGGRIANGVKMRGSK